MSYFQEFRECLGMKNDIQYPVTSLISVCPLGTFFFFVKIHKNATAATL